MAQAILLPKQGQSVESCIITSFFVSTGDRVTAGTPLFAYETDKAAFEEEAAVDGTILALFFSEGDEVPVLTNVGVIGEEGESFDEFVPGDLEADPAGEETVPDSNEGDEAIEASRHAFESAKDIPPIIQSEAPSISGKVFISPRARKRAEDKGVSLVGVQGSGPNGRIIEADVERILAGQPKRTILAGKKIREEGAVSAGTFSGIGQRVSSLDLIAGNASSGSDSEIVPLTNIRKLIAQAMHKSLQNSAQLTHHLSADARNILEFRRKVKAAQKEGYGYNITMNDMICASVISALKEYPRANAHFLGDSLRVFSKVHLGLAVDTERGLMVPSIRNADELSVEALSVQMKSVADACRKGSIGPDLLSPEAASFTVSNLGNYGVEMFTPVINLPQVAILGVNTILPRPKDLGNGTYAFVPHLGLSLTYDHQALDGGEATRFLKSVAEAIENFDLSI